MSQKKSPGGSLSQSQAEQVLCRLMRESQLGNGSAYKELLLKIEKMMQSYVRKSVSSDFADDVIQEIILAVHAKRATFNSEQFFLPWLYAIAHYKVVDFIRYKYRREQKNVSIEESEAFLSSVSETSGVVDSLASVDLETILSDLPEKQRRILVRVKIDGLTIKETASEMRLSESDIKVNIHRAMQFLKRRFESGPR